MHARARVTVRLNCILVWTADKEHCHLVAVVNFTEAVKAFVKIYSPDNFQDFSRVLPVENLVVTVEE